MLLALIALAAATPVQIVHQGRVLDAAGGPINGAHTVEVSLCTDPTGGLCAYSQSTPLAFADGYYTAVLGTTVPLDHGQLVSLGWVEVAVDGEVVGQRTPIGAVPVAARALGIDADTITGDQVVDGSLTAADVDTSSLQARVDGSCPANSAVVAIDADGSVTCGSSSAAGIEYRQVNTAAPVQTPYAVSRYIIEATPARVGQVVPLNMTIMYDLCRDGDGCDVTIGMVNWSTSQPQLVASRGERLFMSPSQGWWRYRNNDLEGRDGASGVQEWSPWDCYFGDAETMTNTSNGRADNGPGWGLLNARGGSYSDSTTTCRVVIID